MKKVITYGTYDMLHYGHIRLLERAKELGDYLIVGVTADDFDRRRGKINTQQSLSERIEGVKALGIADKIIVEEYEGQKIDDIRRYGADVFTVGSDWVGKFDYLNEYCEVVYLPRTVGVSSSDIRTENFGLRLGVVGKFRSTDKFIRECAYVDGVQVVAICAENEQSLRRFSRHEGVELTCDMDALLGQCNAVYIDNRDRSHEELIRRALNAGKHVLCVAPIATTGEEAASLFQLADEKGLVLMEAIKTAYSTAYSRLVAIAKSGTVGRVVAVDATCTSLEAAGEDTVANSSLLTWGPVAMLPIFQLLGTEYTDRHVTAFFSDEERQRDYFTRICFDYPQATATLTVGLGVKSEGELIISGTSGYIYVPAPWWKTDYFEVRRENASENRRYYYQLDGEGIRFEIAGFQNAVKNRGGHLGIERSISCAIARTVGVLDA